METKEKENKPVSGTFSSGMYDLPPWIRKSLRSHRTSLGDNPALPKGGDVEIEEKLVAEEVKRLEKKLSKFEELQGKSVDELSNRLGGLIQEVKKLEEPLKGSLEELSVSLANSLFQIPDDTIVLEAELVDNVDVSMRRMSPEEDVEIELENSDDLEWLDKQVYRRRFINSLIQGAALRYATSVRSYLQDVYDMDDRLPAMYEQIMNLNEYLLYFGKGISSKDNNTPAGDVEVTLGNQSTRASIRAKGIIFPVLLDEVYKGFLELFSAHALPRKKEQASYVLKKADFLYAEAWDIRLGLPIWNRIEDVITEACGESPEKIGLPFLFTALFEMDSDEFNTLMKDVLLKTKSGKEGMKHIGEYIKRELEQDDFDNYMKTMNNGTVMVNDSEYFLPEEL